jgi:hypothetical protein
MFVGLLAGNIFSLRILAPKDHLITSSLSIDASNVLLGEPFSNRIRTSSWKRFCSFSFSSTEA